jgi:hypothetical protein
VTPKAPKFIALALCVSLLASLGLLNGDFTTPFTVIPFEKNTEYPIVNLPYPLRQKNWSGSLGQGSCVHASMVTLFRWYGRFDLAEWWRKNHGNGETQSGLSQKLTEKGIYFAETTSGDVKFLEWCVRTRRGAGIVWSNGAHMLNLVDLNDRYASILDNNRIDVIQKVPRDKFVAEWRRSGGWAVTPVIGHPASPLPVL